MPVRNCKVSKLSSMLPKMWGQPMRSGIGLFRNDLIDAIMNCDAYRSLKRRLQFLFRNVAADAAVDLQRDFHRHHKLHHDTDNEICDLSIPRKQHNLNAYNEYQK